MKTKQLGFLSTLLLAMMAARNAGYQGPKSRGGISPGGAAISGNAEYHPRHGKLKGYMRENRRTDRGPGYMKYKFQ